MSVTRSGHGGISSGGFGGGLSGVSDEARALHDSALVVDWHADTFLWRRLIGYDIWQRHRPLPFGSPLLSHCDMPRLLEGGVDVQGFGVVTSPWPRGEGAIRSTLKTLRIARRELGRRPDVVRVLDGGGIEGGEGEIAEAHAAGRMSAFFGVEGAHGIGCRPEMIGEVRRLGVRYLGLVHLTPSEAGCPSNWPGARRRGLGPAAPDLIAECERQGVLVDLAHMNRRGFFEAVRLARRPVIVSHTGVAEVHRSWRNLDAEQIRAVADTGGVIGVIFYPGYLKGRLRCSIDAVVEHIDALVRYGGIDCVALGSDFDGFIPSLPDEMQDVAALPRLTEALLRHGHDSADVLKILGVNSARVLTAHTTKPS